MAKRKRRRRLKKKVVFFFLMLIIICGGLILLKNNDKLNESFSKVKNILPVANVKELQIIDINSNERPVAVMINNHSSARPYHTGLQDAYLIYEIIVEGGYTRYMALYKDSSVDKIGSVRSSRHYFLDYALENDAVYVHWGWSPEAENDIDELNVDNINGLSHEQYYFYRDNSLNVGFEHRGFTKMSLIDKAIEKFGYRKTSDKKTLLNYSVDEIKLDKVDGAIKANEIEIPYSKIVTTSYTYDSNDKVYRRFVNGEEHIDYVTKKQYNVKNIIVYQVSNSTLTGDVKGRQDIDNIGSGTGYYISNGYAVPIKWSKKSRTAQTVYTYMDGTEIKVNDGNTYIQIQPKARETLIK